MSWSVYAIGKPSKVVEKLKIDFEKLNYLSKPENEIAQSIGQAIIAAIVDTAAGNIVKVEASGSMNSNNGNNTHTINVVVVPIYGFLE